MKKLTAPGFTLIEIMIVVGVMGLLLVYTLPKFVGFNHRSTLNSDAQDVVEGFKTVRSLAISNTQDQTTKVEKYRIDLLQGAGDASGCYRGFQTSREDVNGDPILPTFDITELSCPTVIESSWQTATYETTTGVLDVTGATSPASFEIWYPGEGFRTVTIDALGKVSKSDFTVDTSTPTCSTACNAITPVVFAGPTPTPVPTATPVPVVWGISSPQYFASTDSVADFTVSGPIGSQFEWVAYRTTPSSSARACAGGVVQAGGTLVQVPFSSVDIPAATSSQYYGFYIYPQGSVDWANNCLVSNPYIQGFIFMRTW